MSWEVQGLKFTNPNLDPMDLSLQLSLVYWSKAYVWFQRFFVDLWGWSPLFSFCTNFRCLQPYTPLSLRSTFLNFKFMFLSISPLNPLRMHTSSLHSYPFFIDKGKFIIKWRRKHDKCIPQVGNCLLKH